MVFFKKTDPAAEPFRLASMEPEVFGPGPRINFSKYIFFKNNPGQRHPGFLFDRVNGNSVIPKVLLSEFRGACGFCFSVRAFLADRLGARNEQERKARCIDRVTAGTAGVAN